jgi:hypothetical protein
MLTAMIAYKSVSDSVRQAAEELNLVFGGALTHHLTDTIVEAAVYPDDVKNYGLTMLNNWHFINKPYDIDGLLDIYSFPPGNSVWLIRNAMETLKFNTELTFERSFMLKYLLHVVGDLH